MIIVPYRAEHLLDLQLQEGQRYCSPAITPEYAVMLEGQYAFTALAGGKVLAVAGVALKGFDRSLV